MEILYSTTKIQLIKWQGILCAHMPCFCRPSHIYELIFEIWTKSHSGKIKLTPPADWNTTVLLVSSRNFTQTAQGWVVSK